MVHKRFKEDTAFGCGIAVWVVSLLVGIAFWALIIWGVVELIQLIRQANGNA